MTILERQIQACQHRLWLNRFCQEAAIAGAWGGGVFALAVLASRAFDLTAPLGLLGLAAVVVVVAGAAIRTVLGREDAMIAAARLDEAAGLRERVSSGRYCMGDDDPFAQAVVADAERVCSSISVRSLLRLAAPKRLKSTIGSFILAGLMFLTPVGLLRSTEAKDASKEQVERTQVQIAVKKQLESVKKLAEETPVLAEMTDELGDLDKFAGGKLERPADIRHEAVKKIDRLEDVVKEKLQSEKYDALPQLKKMLRSVQPPDSEDAPTQKLAEALRNGDFQAAKEEVEKLRDQLATLKADEDKELAEKMSKQLAEIAKQLEQAAVDDKLAQKLEQLGVKKEDVERMLDRLSKADLEQLQKQLEEKGLSQQQIDKIAKQLQQKQQSGSAAKNLAQAMKQASQINQPGQSSDAQQGLTQAAEQLSELEQLEQELSQLDATASALQDAKQKLDKPCPS